MFLFEQIDNLRALAPEKWAALPREVAENLHPGRPLRDYQTAALRNGVGRAEPLRHRSPLRDARRRKGKGRQEHDRRGAQSVIVSHNHPGGNPEPSDEDVVLPRRLVTSGQTLGIPLLDHVILGNGAIDGIPAFASLRAVRSELFS